jgi:hypothetical protein
MENYVEINRGCECEIVDYRRNYVQYNFFNKISRLEMAFNKDKQETTICVYCVLIFQVIGLNYH